MASMGEWFYLGMEQLDEHFANLAGLQQAQVEALEEIKQAQAAAQWQTEHRENQRERIFKLAQLADHWETHVGQLPLMTYLTTLRLSRNAGVSSRDFSAFQDKAYVQQVLDKLTTISQEAYRRLSREQLAQCEQFFKFDMEVPMLEQAMRAQAAREKLATEVEPNLASARKKVANLNLWGTILVVVAVLSSFALLGLCGSLILVLAASISTTGSANPYVGQLLGSFLGVSVFVASLVVRGSLRRRQKTATDEYNNIAYQYQQLASSINAVDWGKVTSLFGQRDSAGYRQLQKERRQFMWSLLVGGAPGQVEQAPALE